MNQKWHDDLIAASERKNEEQEQEFLRLVDEAADNCTLDVARSLMKTFNEQPDYGTQERVINILATASDNIVSQALLEELPRLLKEAPEWAETLVGLEVENRPSLLVETASHMSQEVRQLLRDVLNNGDFQSFYKGASVIKIP